MSIVDSLKKLIVALNGANSPESVPVKNVDEAIDYLSLVIPRRYPQWHELLDVIDVIDEVRVRYVYAYGDRLYWDGECTEKVYSDELDWELLGRCVLLYTFLRPAGNRRYIPYRPFTITKRGNLNALAYWEGPDTDTNGYNVAYAKSWDRSEET